MQEGATESEATESVATEEWRSSATESEWQATEEK
jgi:hypothetical protein